MKDVDERKTSQTTAAAADAAEVAAHVVVARHKHHTQLVESDERESKKQKRGELEGERKTRAGAAAETAQLHDEQKTFEGMPGVGHLDTQQMVVPMPESCRPRTGGTSSAASFFRSSWSSTTFEPTPPEPMKVMAWNDAEWRFVQERVGKTARVAVSMQLPAKCAA